MRDTHNRGHLQFTRLHKISIRDKLVCVGVTKNHRIVKLFQDSFEVIVEGNLA